MAKIVGIFLVKNEDTYIRQAVENVLDFCDTLILLDNQSSDNTFYILQELQKTHPEKLQLQSIANALDSHDFVKQYANTDTWIFAVDGDELYDRQRLSLFRNELLSGKYDRYWKIFGSCVHIKSVDAANHTALGYMTPPARSITKLFNFNAITEWNEHTERLHGNGMKFKENYDENSMLLLHDQYVWDDSLFRCLHMCFVTRSSLRSKANSVRLNPTENTKILFPIINFVRNLLHGNISFHSSYKLNKYRRGNLNKVSTIPFF